MDCLEALAWGISALLVMAFWFVVLDWIIGEEEIVYLVSLLAGGLTLYLGAWCCGGTPLDPP